MGKYIKFEKMITPIFIQITFWLGFLGSIVGGFATIGYGIISSSGTFIEIGTGLLLLLLGPIIIRVYCEMLIVVFKMQGALMDIRNSLASSKEIVQGKEVI